MDWKCLEHWHVCIGSKGCTVWCEGCARQIKPGAVQARHGRASSCVLEFGVGTRKTGGPPLGGRPAERSSAGRSEVRGWRGALPE